MEIFFAQPESEMIKVEDTGKKLLGKETTSSDEGFVFDGRPTVLDLPSVLEL